MPILTPLMSTPFSYKFLLDNFNTLTLNKQLQCTLLLAYSQNIFPRFIKNVWTFWVSRIPRESCIRKSVLIICEIILCLRDIAYDTTSPVSCSSRYNSSYLVLGYALGFSYLIYIWASLPKYCLHPYSVRGLFLRSPVFIIFLQFRYQVLQAISGYWATVAFVYWVLPAEKPSVIFSSLILTFRLKLKLKEKLAWIH